MFQLDNSTPTASNGSYLAGNQIHKVKFEGAEKGTAGKENPKPVVVIKFAAVDGSGSYEDMIFEPTSFERERSGPQNYLNPSQAEQMQVKFRQYIDALNPTLAKEISEGKKIGAKDWEGMRDVIVAALNSKGKNIGRETELKLLKNKSGYATAPGFIAGLTKPDAKGESKVYHTTKFVGEGLAFTDKEVAAINKQNAATPTDMSAKNNDLDDITGGTNDALDMDDFDVDSL